MAKYDPLEAHLRRQKTSSYEMSFRDIERVLAAFLPHSAKRPEWWGNERDANPSHVQCRAWLNAGYRARPDLNHERVLFER